MIPCKTNPFGAISVVQHVPLTLTALKAKSTVKLVSVGGQTAPGLYYRTDSSAQWTAYTLGTSVSLSDVGDYVQFFNKETTLSSSTQSYIRFTLTGQIAASGNIQSMLNWSSSVPDFGLAYLFYSCTYLYQAPQLPALSLGVNCYRSLFNACSNLQECPVLPATQLTQSCYNYMFKGCKAITKAPILLATVMKPGCYSNMFYQCTSLTEPPVLSSTELASSCYSYMFKGCTALTKAPLLPASTLQATCYAYMFQNCSLLSQIEVGFTKWGSQTTSWVAGVASQGTFIKPSSLPQQFATNKIPTGWTVTNK